VTLPTSYDETNLAAYQLVVLGDVGSVLGFTTASFAEAINDTLLAYGVVDIADATDIARLRSLARVEAWKLALVGAASKYDVSDGTQSLKRSQLMGQIRAALSLAETDASAYIDDGSSTVGRSTVVYADDPYARVGGP
jgi:hypothetical protein